MLLHPFWSAASTSQLVSPRPGFSHFHPPLLNSCDLLWTRVNSPHFFSSSQLVSTISDLSTSPQLSSTCLNFSHFFSTLISSSHPFSASATFFQLFSPRLNSSQRCQICPPRLNSLQLLWTFSIFSEPFSTLGTFSQLFSLLLNSSHRTQIRAPRLIYSMCSCLRLVTFKSFELLVLLWHLFWHVRVLARTFFMSLLHCS